jgi:hypothetical protein
MCREPSKPIFSFSANRTAGQFQKEGEPLLASSEGVRPVMGSGLTASSAKKGRTGLSA